MPFAQVRAIAFDLDGTLIDSGPSLAAALAEALEQMGRPRCRAEDALGWIGNGAPMLVRRGLSNQTEPDPNLDPDLIEATLATFNRIYAQHQPTPKLLYPQVIETLAALKQRGYRMGLVTNKPAQFVPAILAETGLAPYFDYWFGGDSLPERKPSPLPLFTLMDHWQISPAQLLMVGDSRNDILAAKAAQSPSVGLSYGYNYGVPIQTEQPSVTLDRFDQLLAMLPALTENCTQ